MNFREPVTLGRSGLKVSRLGIGAGYGVPAGAIEKAYHEHGINYFYWLSRKQGMTGPADKKQMDEALEALDAGPLSDDEMERVRRIGDHVHEKSKWLWT